MNRLKRRTFAAVMALTLVFTSVLPSPVYAAKAVRSANIYSFSGDVKIKRGGDKTLPAFEGMRLEAGDTIITGSGASAVITIDSDKTIDVDGDTEITLDELSGDASKSKTSTSVFYGNTVNTIKNKLSGGSSYETRTSTAVMGVRGTSYLVSQNLNGIGVLVASGTVAVSPAAGLTNGQPEDGGAGQSTEPVAVTMGSQLQYSISGPEAAPVPIDAEGLMKLTPTVAKALVTEELLDAIPDKPEQLTNVGQLVDVLRVKQENVQKETELKKADQEARIAQKKEAEPAAFFAEPGAKLAGQSNVLLRTEEPKAQTAETKAQNTETGAAARWQPPQALPSKAAETETQAADPSNGTGQTAAVQESTAAWPKESSGASRPDSGSGGSSDGNSGGTETKPTQPVTPTQPEPPIQPTQPTPPPVSVTGVVQDTVYEETFSEDAIKTLAALIVKWPKAAEAAGYLLQTKNTEGGFVPVSSEWPVLQNEQEYGVVIPAKEKHKLQGTVLRITPKVSGTQKAVSTDVSLNFDTESTGKFVKLAMPENIKLNKTLNGYELIFMTTPRAVSYHVSIAKKGTEGIVVLDVTNEEVPIPVPESVTDGTFNIKARAIGDGFYLLDSDEATSNITIPAGRLAQPKSRTLEVTWIEDKKSLQMGWERVEHADGYELLFLNENMKLVDRALISFGSQVTYTYKSEVINDVSFVIIRALDSTFKYRESEWADFPELESSVFMAIPPMIPDMSQIPATPSQALPVPEPLPEPTTELTTESAAESSSESVPDLESPSESLSESPSESETPVQTEPETLPQPAPETSAPEESESESVSADAEETQPAASSEAEENTAPDHVQTPPSASEQTPQNHGSQSLPDVPPAVLPEKEENE